MDQINKQNQCKLSDIRDCIEENQYFLLTSHVKPDGDGLSSLLVFARILEHFGKTYQIFVDDPIPDKFDFISEMRGIQTFDAHTYQFKPDVVVCLDASGLDRIGNVAQVIPQGAKIINIDHHPSNTGFGDLNCVNDQLSGTVELVYQLFDFCQVPMSADVATMVYTGVMCDTGRFLFPNTTHESLGLCSQMIQEGASPDQIAENIYYRKTPETVYAMANALSNMQMHFDGTVSSIHLCNGHYAPKDKIDTEGFIDHLMMIDSSEVSFFILENEPGSYRVSLRSKNYVDVNLVAQAFGGGGHKRAAGCTMSGTVEDIRNRILDVLEKQMKR